MKNNNINDIMYPTSSSKRLGYTCLGATDEEIAAEAQRVVNSPISFRICIMSDSSDSSFPTQPPGVPRPCCLQSLGNTGGAQDNPTTIH